MKCTYLIDSKENIMDIYMDAQYLCAGAYKL